MTRGAVPGYADYPLSRPWTPLVLTLGLHLLLVLAWIIGARGDPARDPPRRAFTFVLVQPVARPKPAPDAPPPLPVPRSHMPARIKVPTPLVPAPTAAARSSDPEPASEPHPEAASGAAPAGDLLISSKAMAGRVDRELRKGSSPITAEPERKWEGFAAAFAAARSGASRTVTLDSYTSPDGVIIYRKTIGDRASCYRSGSVGGLVTGFGNADLHGASIMSCPSGVSWTRH